MAQFNFKDLTGKKFGELLVKQRVEVPEYVKSKSHSYWLCKCNCGNEKIVRGAYLTRGSTESCGCQKRKNVSLPRGKSSKNKIYLRYKVQAKRRNLTFSLIKEEFFIITAQDCYYCGAKPSNISKNYYNNGDFIYNGIDRIDNKQGYIKENTVPCCERCNRAKLTMSLPEFSEWIINTYNHFIEKNNYLC